MIRLLASWAYGLWTARRCRACGCTPDAPCVVAISPDESGVCVPAGAYGMRVCSGCLLEEVS